ncbi:MAG TPA: hypothetical protein VMV23_05150 [Candidatus Nanopelagicaceae bacterium]|nr:hypothetical protein [Candidatus Nanopelagicaceae bacterium]
MHLAVYDAIMGVEEVAAGKVVDKLGHEWRKGHPVRFDSPRPGAKEEGSWGVTLPMKTDPSLVRAVRIFVENLHPKQSQTVTLDANATRVIEPAMPEGTTVSASTVKAIPPESGRNWWLRLVAPSPWPAIAAEGTLDCRIEVAAQTDNGVKVSAKVKTRLEPAKRMPWGPQPPVGANG